MNSNVRAECRCGDVHVRLRDDPLFVHTCHCLDCKRKTGSSFGITCIVLLSDIDVTKGTLKEEKVSPRSTAYKCSSCGTPVYIASTAFPATAWLQTRCILDSRCLEIGAHTFVKRKDNWLQLPDDVPQFQEGYHRDEAWPRRSLERIADALRNEGLS